MPSPFNLNLALVIGINDYQNGIPALRTAKQDAEAIATIKGGDKLTVLVKTRKGFKVTRFPVSARNNFSP